MSEAGLAPEVEKEDEAAQNAESESKADQKPAKPEVKAKDLELPEDRAAQLRLLEAIMFASAEPLDMATLQARFPEGADIEDLLEELRERYAHRGVNLVQRDKKWAFRTAPDLAPYLRVEREVPKQLSRAAVETLAIIAYHQPVTRAEIESIRGVSTSKGTLDLLMEQGWVKPGRRRQTPGRPLTWVTTPHFLDSFGLEDIRDLPGVSDLKAAGLLDKRPAIETIPGIAQDDDADDDQHEDAEDDDSENPYASAETDELFEEDKK